MIIYNKTWLANLHLQSALKNDHRSGCITDAELNLIIEKYPVGFYSPGIWLRVGLFILTCIIALFSGGLLTLMLGSSGLVEGPPWLFILTVFCYIALELIVKQKNHYRSGVDDALLFMTAVLVSIGFYWMISEINNFDADYIPLSGLIFLVSLYFVLRFADMLMAAVCCIAFFAFLFFTWTRAIPAGLATAPFIMMLVSGVAYWQSLRQSTNIKLIYYENCLTITRVICLLALYAAGNYYVIQTLGSEINTTVAVPFGWFFWVWTILLPFVYIVFGLRRKDVILLRAGLSLLIIAAVTFRTYYHILPVDVSLTIVGTGLLGVAYFTIKYLKTPKHGFTYAEPDDPHLMDRFKIESLIVAQTFSATVPANDGSKFGGGDFGGGGSGSSF